MSTYPNVYIDNKKVIIVEVDITGQSNKSLLKNRRNLVGLETGQCLVPLYCHNSHVVFKFFY